MIQRNKNLIIIGAGSLGMLTLDAALEMDVYKSIFFLDDTKETNSAILGHRVLGGLSKLSEFKEGSHDFIIAISNNKVRKVISQEYDLTYTNIIHPKTSISRFSQIKGVGNIILSNTSIDPNVQIFNHVIINKNNSIGHDIVLRNYSQVSPGCSLGGFVDLGEKAFLGLGVSVLPNVKIGKNTTIGAGAVVTEDLSSNITAVGIPAKQI